MIIAIGSADKNLFNDRFQNKKLIQFIKAVNYTIKCNRRDKKVVHQSLMTTEHFSHSPEDIKYAGRLDKPKWTVCKI